ncbi:uncharacterized protein G2W53_026482 [Senna tora]|uniref:Uncharacterized protein n=1 Tax=Senna tora TaxID=362788 RepID=A0A834TH24_9FABA|nr:uncharacterized protein G2W53_026482 [Senna tora]
MVRSRKHDQGYITVKPVKAIATRDGILRVTPLMLVIRDDEEAKELVQRFRMCKWQEAEYTTKAIILKPAKAIATRDGILSVAPLKSVTREHEEAKELVYKVLECAYLREDMISFYIAFDLSGVAWTCRK